MPTRRSGQAEGQSGAEHRQRGVASAEIVDAQARDLIGKPLGVRARTDQHEHSHANGKQSSRINYETVEFNRSIPDSIFSKPSSAKELKKDLKL